MELNEYQRQANLTDQRGDESPPESLVFPLIGIASEVGALINQYKKRIRDGEAHDFFSARVSEELGDVLWYVANVADKLELSLEDIAQLNLRRTRERWPIEASDAPVELLDDRFPPDEQLPRQASVKFVQTAKEDRHWVALEWSGEPLGDPLRDMAHDPDGYRFHDAFHLSYCALLGWSPLARLLFGRRRDSDPVVREVEDGGRAIVIEEGIAAVVFEYARLERFLDGVDHLDFSLLETVRNMVSRLEVSGRTARDWEQAILRSFQVWRQLRDHGGGTLHLDLLARSIEFEAPA
jgi:NTP pyrophosphatase (non-canonical NTP hydrolase)